MGWLKRAAAMAAGFLSPVVAVTAARASDVIGAPSPWEMGMQRAIGPLKQHEIDLHTLVLIIITLITLFVGALLVVVMVRFNAKRHPVPTQTTHNTVLEVAWTVIPVLVLVIIAIPSFRLIYYQDRAVNPDLTIKVTAHQWYWEYAYPDQKNVDITSHRISDDDLKPGQLRLLDADQSLMIPVGKKVRILITSGDVIHSFFIPSVGVQRYAIPGRTIETWMESDKAGTFYGECNQICGQNHSQMPISVQAVPQAQFDAWITQQEKAAEVQRPVKVAGP